MQEERRQYAIEINSRVAAVNDLIDRNAKLTSIIHTLTSKRPIAVGVLSSLEWFIRGAGSIKIELELQKTQDGVAYTAASIGKRYAIVEID